MLKQDDMIHYLFLCIMICPIYSLQWNCNHVTMTNETGIIAPVEKKYKKSNADVQCGEWMIQGKIGTTITIKFLLFDNEFGYDSFFVFDGNSSTSKLVLSMSGRHSDVSITSTSNQIYLYFYTESSKYTFLIMYSINSCPNNCSNNGICSNGKCNCQENHIGISCEMNFCLNNCNILGGNKCDQNLKSCICGNDFFGESCSIPYKTNSGLNSWYPVSSSAFIARSSHVAVFISNCLIIHGGFTNGGLSDQLLYFNISTNQWKVFSTSEPKPASRYDHAGDKYDDGFLIFGGELTDGSLSNEIWYYNNKWLLLSNDNAIPGLAGHSVTVVGSKVFIFGGRISDDKISSTMYIYHTIDNMWKAIDPMPALQSRLRLVGHTASYYKEKETILIYGGLHYTSKNAKSEVSNDMLAFNIKLEKWSLWVNLSQENSSPALAFHSAVISSNHLVLHGGWIFNTDRNEHEPSNATYFYNLMCSLWVSYPLKSNGYPLKKRYLHTALMMDMQNILIVGGFNGAFLLNDVVVLKIPSEITGFQCFSYSQDKDKCLSDLSCIYCSSCVPYYEKNTCLNVVLPYLCRDQCSFLTTCEDCTAYTQCNWCTLTSYCQSKENRNCFQDHSLWWGSNNGILINDTDKCQVLDEPPGITYLYYIKPENFDYPDYIKVLPQGSSIIYNVTSKATLILRGTVYPFFRYFDADSTNHKVLLRGKNLNATLSLSNINSASNLVEVVSLPFNDQYHEVGAIKNPIFLYNKIDSFQTRNLKYLIELKANLINLGSDQYAAIEIQWNHTDNKFFALYPIPGSYLEPFKTTNCSQHFSCSGCVSDGFCGWCDTISSCIPRSSWSVCFNISASYLIRDQSQCTLCKDIFDCESCKKDFFCDWDDNLLKCTRKEHVQVSSNCSSCNKKSTIDECLTVKHCVWCSEKKKCLYNFQVAMQNKYGECRIVYDGYMLQNCSTITNCTSCLNAFHCGWCYDFDDPRIGRCTIGDFSGPIRNFSNECQVVPTKSEVLWIYDVCPDINECILDIFSCDINAYCVNTIYSYECKCKQGYTGDGKSKCIKTCWPNCYQGVCNETTYKCECNLGWTGQNCSIDCACNGHSTCLNGVGICDKCLENTVGKYCEACKNGSYGNALSSIGCKECECNGHGNPFQNYCQSNGKCFCMHNTIGNKCESCEPGFVGDPRNNGICYISCKRSSIIFGSHSGYLSPATESNTSKYTTCVWLISPRNLTLNEYIYSDSMQFNERILISVTNLTSCLDSQLFVYNGIPPNPRNKKEINETSFKKLGRLCGMNNKKTFISFTGMLSLVYEGQTSELPLKRDSSNFLIMFQILQCPDYCPPPYICTELGVCSCKDGFYGNNCEHSSCLNNCNSKQNQGTCMDTHCLCKIGFAGEDCSQLVSNLFWQISTMHVYSSVKHYVEDGRFGGTMVVDDSYLYIFGGRNFSDLKDPDVIRVNLMTGYKEVLSLSGESETPSSRYFHCSFLYKKDIYIYGGITSDGFSNEIWKFNVLKNVWTDLTRNFLEGKKVAGHTCTLFEDVVYIIGGYYWIDGYSVDVRLVELKMLTEQYQKFTGPTPSGIYGHVSVYYPEERKIFVHGGIRFHKNIISNQLHIFDPVTGHWNLAELIPGNSAPFIFGHSGHMINGTLFILSGYDRTNGFNNNIYIWRPVCNSWSLLQKNALSFRDTENTNLLFALSASFNNTIYLYGGFNYNVNGKLVFFSVPIDICAYHETKLNCLSEIFCNWCSIVNGSFCFDENVKSCSENVSLITSSMSCSVNYERECSSYASCRSCLKNIGCKWCQGSYCDSSSSSCVTMYNEVSLCLTASRLYCVNHTTCINCLNAQAFEDFGSPGCLWSEKLSTCVAYSLLPLMCSFGSCGQLYSKETVGQCPISCDLQENCLSCTKLAHCGWCADNNSGSGRCLKGDIEGPTTLKCGHANFNTLGDNTDIYAINKTWVFIVCPLENECEFLKKPCNKYELCIDKDVGFECDCQPGYTRLSSGLSCVPVCENCVNGKCIAPYKCNCSFGWTGVGCDVPCQCNGYSNCANETHTSICLDCMHNTMGSNCDKCKPLYVGDPTSGLYCQECRSVCNNNTDVCMRKEDFLKFKNNFMSLSHGPKGVDDVKCLNCKNNSEGDLCDTCIDGFFRILNGACQLCRCNNHSKTCNKSTGEECQCYHNTKSLTCKKECYKEQCTHCVNGFIGNPINGKQCYEKIVTSFMPKRRIMLSARSSFFMISPHYTNVNMRIIIDVIEGELEVYLADSDEYYVASQNATQSHNFSVIFEPEGENSEPDDYTLDELPSELYYRVINYFGNVLLAKNVKRRLLITVKYSVHDLSKKNFYIAVSTINKPNSAFFIYYSQDLVRLNLTLFILVLIVCVLIVLSFVLLAWKARQFYLQEIIIGEEELALKTMGIRPFGTYKILCRNQEELFYKRRTKQNLLDSVTPLAIQTTKDNLASVIIVIVQLPSNELAECFCLGSGLTLAHNQYLLETTSNIGTHGCLVNTRILSTVA